MTTHRPAECPVCGHERLRRRGREESPFARSAAERVEEWVCGLCRYQWETPARLARPSLPL